MCADLGPGMCWAGSEDRDGGGATEAMVRVGSIPLLWVATWSFNVRNQLPQLRLDSLQDAVESVQQPLYP